MHSTSIVSIFFLDVYFGTVTVTPPRKVRRSRARGYHLAYIRRGFKYVILFLK